MTSDRVPSAKTQCHWRLSGWSKHHSVILNNNYVYCWILELRHALMFCSVTWSASCTAVQGSTSITFFQYCYFLHQHTDILNEIQLPHIFHCDFLFSYFLPISFFFFPNSLPTFFSPKYWAFLLCLYVCYPSILHYSHHFHVLVIFSPISYTTCLFLLLPFLRASSASSFLHCFKIASFSFYFSHNVFCGHPWLFASS